MFFSRLKTGGLQFSLQLQLIYLFLTNYDHLFNIPSLVCDSVGRNVGSQVLSLVADFIQVLSS